MTRLCDEITAYEAALALRATAPIEEFQAAIQRADDALWSSLVSGTPHGSARLGDVVYVAIEGEVVRIDLREAVALDAEEAAPC